MFDSLDSIRNMFSLEGKIALVAGGAGGIGGACARGFAAFGAKLVLCDISEKSLAAAKESFAKLEIEVDTYCFDIASDEQTAAVVQYVYEKYGRIDILLNNIAVTDRKPILDFTSEEWLRIIDINLNGAYRIMREAGKLMIAQKSGKIINIASTGAFRAGGSFSAYGASKAGMVALTRSAALDWADYNINVNAIAPTATDTNFTHAHYEANPQMKQNVINNHPFKRLGMVEDYIGAAVYLASEASAFVNGEIIVVDSGKTIK